MNRILLDILVNILNLVREQENSIESLCSRVDVLETKLAEIEAQRPNIED